ncbi:MAG: glycoside hydrolase family 2 [Oscillospiraceae bacterium]|nr:glycoside hydrolase family 2 [Oscillospiraceae bacterium]
MRSRFFSDVDPACPLAEYPRPQLQRDNGSWLCLNGPWQYAITPLSQDTAPAAWDGIITVPFSPECELSGVMRTVTENELLWYRRSITLPETFAGKRVLIHFGAVDQIATLYVNGSEAGSHRGGYNAFTFDITRLLKAGENELLLKVWDPLDKLQYARGKQSARPGTIWYTAQSGIWQTVWLEAVPQQYISRLHITPLFDEAACLVTVRSETDAAVTLTLGTQQFAGRSNEPVRLQLPADFRAWSPEDPYLYEFSAQLGDDRVQSYFGMRKFSCEFDEKGVRRLFLNGKPYFHNGVLDQGYWPDGLYTAPTDAALIFDIQTMKAMGFNTLRKHIKVESARWYYHCDRLGMLVWQDMPCGGGNYSLALQKVPVALSRMTLRDSAYRAFARSSEEGRAQYYRALREMLEQLHNVTSLAVWVPFNEGWGQFDAAKALELVQSIDNTRTVDHASGWYDQGVGELLSLHIYFKPVTMQRDAKKRAFCVTEFGGLTLALQGHTCARRTWGYFRSADRAKLAQDFKKLYRRQIIPLIEKGLAAAIYTQLSDVEGEVNGLLTYDREVIKIDPAAVREAVTP